METDDVTAKIVGDFGRWQLQISILMTLLKLPNAWYQLNIIFLAPPQNYWCKKPASFCKYSDELWRQICSPLIEEHPCLIFDPDILIQNKYTVDKSTIPMVSCKHFVYDTSQHSRTITSEWDLVCKKHWLIHFTQCVLMWGVLLGGVVFGTLADKYGRKNPLMMAIVLQSLASYIASAVKWYWLFIINWFILALACGGIGIISFVICMEVVSGKWRTLIPILYHVPFGLGNAIMAVLAYWLRDWRKLEFVLASLSGLYIVYWFLIPESPRWLLATGQTEQALEVLKKAAIVNRREAEFHEYKNSLPKPSSKKIGPGFMTFMKLKNMRKKSLLLSGFWFFTGLAFYAFSQFLGSLGKNIFLTVAMTGIISTPGGIICACIISKIGRKTTLWIFQLVTALCFVAILLIPRNVFENDWPRLLFAGIGFAGMAGTVPVLYLFSGELYPTIGRNAGVGGVSTFARIGSMVAPFVVSLNDIREDLPLILLAISSFLQLLFLLPLPETKGVPLPDTVEQAEKFTGKNKEEISRFKYRRNKRSDNELYMLQTPKVQFKDNI